MFLALPSTRALDLLPMLLPLLLLPLLLQVHG
jgi:hypothetical protein